MDELSRKPTRPARESLTWRFVLLVAVTTLPAALLAAWVSSAALERAVWSNFEARALHALDAAHARLEVWWSEREREVAQLAQDALVIRTALVPDASRASAVQIKALDGPRGHLEGLRARSPHVRTLFVADASGEVVLAVGEPPDLPASLLRERARAGAAPVSPLLDRGAEQIQVVSAPLGAGEPALALHAIVRIPLEELLRAESDIALFLVGHASAPWSPQSAAATRALPHSAAGHSRNGAGAERVVRATRAVPRFGWTLVVEEPVDGALAQLAGARWLVLLIHLAAALIGGGLAFWLALPIARRVRVLTEAAQGLAEGKHWASVPEREGRDEIDLLTRAFNRMAARMTRNQRELRVNREKLASANAQLRGQNEELLRLNQSLEQLSNTDGLTGLFNHRCFQEQLTREIARVERSGDPLSLVLIDIDDFKLLNDTHGHATGDAALREVARTMGTLVRDADMLARYGGEEFALLAVRADLPSAVAIAEKIRLALARTRVPLASGGEVRVSVSIGVSCYAGDRRRFFEDADRALYRAKEQGKDCVCS
jgi:diguanylate cyclase (GGDEF)-like protein